MVSARRVRPRVAGPLYAYLFATSHFGRGRVAVAFYAGRGPWLSHGIRNAGRADAQRLGWHTAAAGLSACDSSGARRA